ncbi:MAG TPA: glycosyltransferase family 9 protein [Candidatus Acidoferrum sp.]
MSEPRFLVVRLGSLGDIIHTFPAVAALRESFPAADIVWLTHPRWDFLVQSSGLASDVWTVETRALTSLRAAIASMRQSSWSAAIDYQGLWKSAMLPFFGGVTRRIGFSSATIREFGVPLLYTERVGTIKRHIAEQNGDLSLRAGAQRGTAPVSLQIPERDQASVCSHLRAQGLDRYVVLSPGGGWRSKCWPAERFGALCRKLRESVGLRCVVNIGPGDDHLAAPLIRASGDAAPYVYRGILGELMALLRGASSVVGGDTGPLHLAAALGAPLVALFGPTDPARNGPYRAGGLASSEQKSIVLRASGVRTTHKRGSQPHPAMLAITVDQVFEAVCSYLGAVR